MLQQRDLALGELWQQLILVQGRVKNTVDHGRREIEFQEGDLVYLKLRPNEKLSPRYFSPLYYYALAQ